MRAFFAPEVVQTSAMDCGPASLRCLLEGFGKHVSYGRLREASQTGIDGSSIDTMETVANLLGLEAEQIMVPVDHLLIRDAKTLPAIVVVKLPTGLTHFVVVWRTHGPLIQIMDPAVGRRWAGLTQFANDVYVHSMEVPAAGWHEFAASDEFQTALQARFRALRISERDAKPLMKCAHDEKTWRGLGALDAALRFTKSVVRSGELRRSRDRLGLLEQLYAKPELIPARYWSVQPASEAHGEEQLLMRGAVLVRIRGTRPSKAPQNLSPELRAAVEEKPISAARELLRLLRQGGTLTLGLLLIALATAAAAMVIEALLFRALFDITGSLALSGQRIAAISAVLAFSFTILLLEFPTFLSAARLGRQIENRLRIAFLSKLPKLGDRYFQSRLISDMAERSHMTHRLRHLPDLMRQLLRSIFELCATATGVVWLDRSSAPFVLATVATALVPAFLCQSVLAERDLRVRSHSAGLTRFYLDAMLGLVSIRAHSAESSIRREHETLLGEWAHAALRFQKAVLSIEGIQITTIFGLIAALLIAHPLSAGNVGRVLLIVYWALNLPSLGQEIAALSRQYPSYRNLTLRLLEPLGAPEEESLAPDNGSMPVAPLIEFQNVSVEASGHKILEDINLKIDRGSEIAIVGQSGAGKSSLVGMLLGWLKPSQGQILIDGSPLDVDTLRKSTAWVDPAVQLWNRSLFANLSYGSATEPSRIGQAVDRALLRGVLETLPDGLETKLGEGGGLVSGGEGQRVRLARAMLRNHVRLVILDEPFRGLDREKRRELLRRAREFWRGCTVLCITHDLSETHLFDRVAVLEQGRIAEYGIPEQLCAQAGSRYSQLLAAEEQTRSGLWGAKLWRRIHIHSGRIVEEHKPVEEKRLESEVA